jgi:hypothetical protein
MKQAAMDGFRTCRVVIDLRRIQDNLQVEGALLRERDVKNWLKCVGFQAEPDGQTWRANEECLRSLNRTEFRRV